MNYANIYESFMSNRQLNRHDDNVVCETHHILPKALGGTDDVTNLVSLTPREHFIAHKLLVKIYPHSVPLNKALWVFLNGGRNGVVCTSRQYEACRLVVSQHMTQYNPMFDSEVVAKHTASLQVTIANGFRPYLATVEGRSLSSARMKSAAHPMKNKDTVRKKLQTDRSRGNTSWMTTDCGKQYFSAKWSSDEHPLRRSPWRTRTAYKVLVELVDGSIICFRMLKDFYEMFDINKDVAASMIKHNRIPKKHQSKFRRVEKYE